VTTGPALDTATATPEQEQQAKTKYGARESSRTDTARACIARKDW